MKLKLRSENATTGTRVYTTKLPQQLYPSRYRRSGHPHMSAEDMISQQQKDAS